MFQEEKQEILIPKEMPKQNELKNTLESIRTEQASIESKFSACPDCGSPLRAEEGCFKCTNEYCGYSKCS
jgi:uncharacterized protein with PIN domain